MADLMENGRKIIYKIRDEGFRQTAALVSRKLLTDPLLLPLIKPILGEVRFQQLHSYSKLGYCPDIKKPKTFNEKIQNLMLFSDRNVYSTLHNKWSVRKFVFERVGDDILNDVHCVTDDPEEIPFGELPESYVVKPTVGSGPIIFIREGESPNSECIKKTCEEWLSMDYRRKIATGHYWYEDANPGIIVEDIIKEEGCDSPLDYKFYVFHGRVEYIHVDFDRFGVAKRRFFDRKWNPMNFKKGGVQVGPVIDKPAQFDKMIDIAEQLAEGFDFMRVDLYHPDDTEIVFGEMSISPGAGRSPFEPSKIDFEFGELW